MGRNWETSVSLFYLKMSYTYSYYLLDYVFEVNIDMNYHNILAAKLNLDLDYKRIIDEILSCHDAFIPTPPKEIVIDDGLDGRVFLVADKQIYKNSDYIDATNNIITKNIKGPNIFYLRISNNVLDNIESYAKSKQKNIDEYTWRLDLLDKISYTKNIIENMFTKIGIVRVFVTKDTFIPAHRDYGDLSKYYKMKYFSTEYQKVLGLSLIPSTGDVPMKIYSPLYNKVVDVPGNAMLFNDSAFHGVPVTNGYRITIRIFGELDYSQFDNNLDMDHTHFLKRYNIV